MSRNTSALIAACCLAVCVLLTSCGSSQPTKEQVINQKDTWAEGVLRAAIDDLEAQGAIDKVSSDSKLIDGAFAYDKVKDGYGIVLKDGKIEADLTGGFSLPEGKVVLCDPDYNEKMKVFYLDGSSGKYGASVPSDAPLFFPESAYGFFSEDGMRKLLDGVDPGRFSNDLDGCDYLIAFDSVYSHIDENYYFGSIDRTSCTTFAIVVDAKAKKVLHIENIGTDTPPDSVKSGGEVGQMLYEELIDYLNGLLRS